MNTSEGKDFQREEHLQPKRGMARMWEILDRDYVSLFLAGAFALAGLVPYMFAVIFALESGLVPLLIAGSMVGGIIATPQIVGLLDTILRSLRDAPFLWWLTYREVWRQNLRSSILPGAVIGLLIGMELFAFRNVSVETVSGSTLVIYLVSIVFTVGISLLLLLQIPMMELRFSQMFRNSILLFAQLLPRAILSAAIILGYGILCGLFFPASLIFLILMNTWLPFLLGTMVLYPKLNEILKIEKRLATLFSKELDE